MAEYQYSYKVVPSGPEENALWRKQTLDYCSRDHPDALKFRKIIIEQCRKDFWYFAKGFASVHEPRILDDDADAVGFDTKVPFLPWPHQVPVINRILKVLGKRDLRVVKSRAQGASWILVLVFVWMWLFHRGFKGNLVSKDETAVDRRNDMGSLMGKMDWLLALLPWWMVGEKGKQWNRNYGAHTLVRLDGETAITGYACTQDVASGDRCLVFGVDEHAKHPRPYDEEAMASTQPISRCRIYISTPKGQGGAFHGIVHDTTVEEPVLYLDWRENPTQNRWLYRVVKGVPVAVEGEKYSPLREDYLDSGKWLKLKARLEERGYDLTDKRERSPWYDEECLRPGANPTLIAQEYDMQFGAESARYFAEALVNRLLNLADPRFVRGDFHVDSETLKGFWSENPDGHIKLWTDLDISNRPPMGEYIVGCDVSLGLGGSGGSNSCITVLNRRTGRKVLAYAWPKIEPHELAELAIGLCKWFCNRKGDPAFLIWENQGPGKTFCQRMERSGFQHYYRRPPSSDGPLHARQTDRPGYWNQKPQVLLGPYKEALLEGYFYNPDRDAIEELKEYQLDQKGTPYHLASKDKTDPAGSGTAHGDRIIADSLAWHASVRFGDQHEKHSYGKKSLNVMNVREDDVARESFAWRRAQYLKMLGKQEQKSNW